MTWFDLFKRKPPLPNEPGADDTAPAVELPRPLLDPARAAQVRWETQLTAKAEAWIAALPANARPLQLSARIPRLANRLAAAWHDVARTRAVLDELLVDRRGGRRGFPPAIAAELRVLQALRQPRADGAEPSVPPSRDSQ